MKTLILNASPRNNGNTSIAIREIEQVLNKEGIDVECIKVGNLSIKGCTACLSCRKNGKCVFDDCVNEIAKKFENSDALILASPVYFASANGTLISLLDRLFYSTKFNKSMKVGASIVCARRGGCSSTFDQLNKYFTIANMPVASSCYWNNIHGLHKKEADQDAEGLRTMRVLAQNIAFLVKSINLGKKEYGLPQYEPHVMTNFIN